MDKKVERILNLYNRMNEGEVLVKSEEAARFQTSEKSIQRDIEDIRAYLADTPETEREVVYDRDKKGYVLIRNSRRDFTNGEVLTICKILLESRSLVKEEMDPLMDKLLRCCELKKDYDRIKALIGNERFLYIEPHHGKKYLDRMWDIASAVYECRLMRIGYHKLKDPEKVVRMIQPVGLMFSEFYFYICAFICKSEETPDIPRFEYPTTYRVDRIEEYEILDEHFKYPHKDRFQEGEFRKRVQFMFTGKLRKICFRYTGYSIEAVLDRLPTAEIVSEDEKGYIIKAEVYGDGVDMWIRSQGEAVEMIDDGK